MKVITQSDLQNAKDSDYLEGVILVKNYSISKTKNGLDYIQGQIQSGVTASFKVWSSSSAFSPLKDGDYVNKVCYVTGEFSEYRGQLSFMLSSIQAVEGYQASQFMPTRYQKDLYVNALILLLKQNLSEVGYDVACEVLMSDEELFGRFTEEFAAMSHHDNCKTGLLAHTYKALCLASWVLSTYPTLYTSADDSESQSRKDLVILGVLLHDVGKVFEMKYGVYQPETAVGHIVLGLDILFKHKDYIISKYNTKFFRDLQSIIVEHHDEYEAPAKTVVAYIVSKVDEFEARMTGLTQSITENAFTDTTGTKVRMDGKILSL